MKWFKLPEGMTNVSIGGLIHEAFEGIISVHDEHEETVRTLVPVATQVGQPEWAKEESPKVPLEGELDSENIVQQTTVSSFGSLGNLGTVGNTGTTVSSTGSLASGGTVASTGILDTQPTDGITTTKTGTDAGSGKKDDTFTTKTVGET